MNQLSDSFKGLAYKPCSLVKHKHKTRELVTYVVYLVMNEHCLPLNKLKFFVLLVTTCGQLRSPSG